MNNKARKKMEKLDYKKIYKDLYAPSAKKVTEVFVPDMKFLMIDGMGNPNEAEEFQVKTEALYAVAYTVKFMAKALASPVEYAVMPLEGLWWSDNMDDFLSGNKSNWKWTLMIMHPDVITSEIIQTAITQASKKKENPYFNDLRFETYAEGNAAQIMHIGPYDTETENIQKIHQTIKENGYQLSGLHHEIYLSDPRRTAPEKWRTVVRQPFS
jgi:hypothetical protein